MGRLIALALFLHKALLIILAIIFLVFFLATAHSFNFDDSEQMKYFFVLFIFLLTAIFLTLFNRRKGIQVQRLIYFGSVVGLIVSTIVLLYVITEIFKVKYGDDKPYLIFILLLFGLINGAFLLVVFVLKKDILLNPK